MRVFKYTSKFGPAILRERRLKVSAAVALNDPFELSPRIDSSRFTSEHMKKILSKKVHFDEVYRKEGAQRGFTNKKRFKAHYFATLDERIAALQPKVARNVEGVRENFVQYFDKQWRLFCAAKIPDSILMWSHYGLDHTGMAIEFDTERSVFKSAGKQHLIFEVQYSSERAEFFYKPNDNEDFIRALVKVVATKAREWEYEAEVRMMFPVVMCQAGSFVAFNPEAVQSVTFGCRCPENYQREVLDLLVHQDFSHVPVYRYRRSKGRYELEKETVKTAA